MREDKGSNFNRILNKTDSQFTSTPKPVSKTWPPKPMNVPTEIPRHKKIDEIVDNTIERIEADE